MAGQNPTLIAKCDVGPSSCSSVAFRAQASKVVRRAFKVRWLWRWVVVVETLVNYGVISPLQNLGRLIEPVGYHWTCWILFRRIGQFKTFWKKRSSWIKTLTVALQGFSGPFVIVMTTVAHVVGIFNWNHSFVASVVDCVQHGWVVEHMRIAAVIWERTSVVLLVVMIYLEFSKAFIASNHLSRLVKTLAHHSLPRFPCKQSTNHSNRLLHRNFWTVRWRS